VPGVSASKGAQLSLKSKVQSPKSGVAREDALPTKLALNGTERSLFRGKPGFRTYYRIGVVYSKHAAWFATYEEIGRAFGITKQNAYTECVVALGKALYHLIHSIEAES